MTVQMLVRAITGHNFLSKHQNTIGEPIAPECRLCNEDLETFIHLLTDCPVLHHTRREIFLTDKISRGDPWNIRSTLQFIHQTEIIHKLTEKGNYNCYESYF